MKTYKIIGKTNPWIAQRDSLFKGKCEITIHNGLTIESAKFILLAFFNADYDTHFGSWANLMRSNTGKAYATHYSDGTYSYDYDSRKFIIEEE